MKGTAIYIYRVQGGFIITIAHPKSGYAYPGLATLKIEVINLFYHLWHLFVRILLQICGGGLNLNVAMQAVWYGLDI